MKKYLKSGFNTTQNIKLEAGTYSLVAYVKSLYGNTYTFALGYDGAQGVEWTEYDVDVVKNQLCKVWFTFTIREKITKLKPISSSFSASLPVYVADLQLTRGNVPVESGASPFDFDEIIEGIEEEIDKAQADANKAAAITDKFSSIEGGLITGVVIDLHEPEPDENKPQPPSTAGFSGIQGGEKDLPFAWGGGSYQDAIGGTAKAIIRHDGTSKFTDTEITGTVNATEGFLANWTFQGNTIISIDGSVEIDSETNTISLVNPSGGRIVIKNSEIPDILMLFPPYLSYEESLDNLNYDYDGDTRTSHIVVAVSDNAISELIISSYTIVHMMFEEIATEIYIDSHIYIDLLHDGVFSRRLAEDRHRIFLHDDVKNYTKTIDVPSMRIPIYESGTWSIRVAHSKTTESGVVYNENWLASATISGMGTIRAETVINRTEIGSNGMVVATSPENYTYDAGDLFQVRRGKYGLQVTDEGIKGCDAMNTVAPDWYPVKLITPYG